MADLSYDEISQLLKYEPETGKLFWLPRPEEMFAGSKFHGGASSKAKTWNARYAGKQAFTSFHTNGYVQGGILGRGYLAHRVVWLFENGCWPKDQIDHINGDRSDNRISNLRAVSNAENAKNMCVSTRNKSGVPGVYWNGRIRRWGANIGLNGRTKNLGHFVDLQQAIDARRAAEVEHGYFINSRRGG